jgi:hypothetical protein
MRFSWSLLCGVLLLCNSQLPTLAFIDMSSSTGIVQWCAGRTRSHRFGEQPSSSKRQRGVAGALAAAAAASAEHDSQAPSAAASAAAVVAAAALSAPQSLLCRLAVVEVQLVLQLLDRASKVSLAQCNRHMLFCASHPFPWQHERVRFIDDKGSEDGSGGDIQEDGCPAPWRVGIKELLQHNESDSRTLLRFVPATMDVDAGDVSVFQQLSPIRFPLLQVVKPPARLWYDRSTSVWMQLLASPLAPQLREIDLGTSMIDDALITLLLPLQRLHTLRLVFAPSLLPPASPSPKEPQQQHLEVAAEPSPFALLDPLARLPALTDLRIASGHFQAEGDASASSSETVTVLRAGLFHSISLCTGLRHLTLDHLCWLPGELLQVFQMESLRGLESLSLHRLTKESYGSSGSLGVYDAAFARMERLHTLSFRNVMAIQRLLPHLASLPVLRLLHLEPAERFDPRASVLAELLASSAPTSASAAAVCFSPSSSHRPVLHVRFSMRCLSLASNDLHIKDLVWRRALINCAPGRVTIAAMQEE